MSLHAQRLIAILGATIWLAGCATVAPISDLSSDAPAFAFSAGRATQDFAAPPGVVAGALAEAMGDLNMGAIRNSRDGAVVQLEAKTEDKRPVLATLRSHQNITRVSTRIGWFGDEPLSRSLLDRLAVRLGSRPPEAIPTAPPSAPSANPFFSRSAVPDSIMLRDFAEAPFRDRVVP